MTKLDTNPVDQIMAIITDQHAYLLQQGLGVHDLIERKNKYSLPPMTIASEVAGLSIFQCMEHGEIGQIDVESVLVDAKQRERSMRHMYFNPADPLDANELVVVRLVKKSTHKALSAFNEFVRPANVPGPDIPITKRSLIRTLLTR